MAFSLWRRLTPTVALSLALVCAMGAAEAKGLHPSSLPALPQDQALRALKERQLRRLLSLVAAERGRVHGVAAARLHQVCLLERELGILASGTAANKHLANATTACRRLLASRASRRYARRDEALLTLAGLELRAGRRQQARDLLDDLLRRRGAGPMRCAALLARANTLAGRSKKPFIEAYRGVLAAPSCRGAGVRQERVQARYKLAWALVRADRPAEGQRQLRLLLSKERPKRRFTSRILRDLAAIWGAHGPPKGAAKVLAAYASAAEAPDLAARVAEGLIGQRRLSALLSFCAESGRTSRLAALRLRGLGELASADALLAEARSWGPRRGDSALRRHRASALLRGARRLRAAALRGVAASGDDAEPGEEAVITAKVVSKAEPRGLSPQVRALYELLAKRFRGLSEASAASLVLADAAHRGGRLALASRHLRDALVGAPKVARGEIAYRQLVVLQALVATLKGSRGARRRADFMARAETFLRTHQGHPRVADVSLARLEALAAGGAPGQTLKAAEVFLARFASHTGVARARGLAVVAARSLKRYPLVYRLALAAAREPKAPRSWGAVAASAALAQAKLLARDEDTKLAEARRWVDKALALKVGSQQRQGQLLAAWLAARSADAPRLSALGRELLSGGTKRRERLRLRRQLARWHRALGDLGEAARLELAALADAVTPAQRVRQQMAAARDLLDAGRGAEAAPLLRVLRRDLLADPAPGRVVGRAMLRLGEILARKTPRRAYGFYLQRADALWRTRRRLAAALLLGAVRLAPSPRRAAQLASQAVGLLPRLRRQGSIDRLAAESRLVLVETWRRRGWAGLASPSLGLDAARRQVASLSALYQPLLPLLALRDARWSSAAGVNIAWLLGRMARSLRAVRQPALRRRLHGRIVALQARRRAVLTSLARLASKPATLNRFTLAAARQGADPARFAAKADALPAPRPATSALLALLRKGNATLAERLAGEALGLHGPRADLLCLRAVALLRRGKVAAAVVDLQAARRVDATLPAARLNWAAVALWRGASEEARVALAGLSKRKAGSSTPPAQPSGSGANVATRLGVAP